MSLRSRLDKLHARERRLLSTFLMIAGALAALAGPVGLISILSSKRADNQEVRELITAIDESRNQIADRRAQKEALLMRYAKPAPPLASFIDESAKSNGISAAESTDRP